MPKPKLEPLVLALALALVAACTGGARRSGATTPEPSSKAPGASRSSGTRTSGGGSTSTPSEAGDVQRGQATWYGGSLHGGPTASGETFDKRALTAAHRSLRFNSKVRVTNEKNGKSVVVRINDRGPFGNKKRIIDVSERAAEILDMIDDGVVPVRVDVLEVPPKKK